MRRASAVYTTVLLILFFLIIAQASPVAVYANTLSADSSPAQILKERGIKAPYTYYYINAPKTLHINEQFKLIYSNRKYMIIQSSNLMTSYISIPGHPALPVKTYKIVINGYVPAELVHAYIYIKSIGELHVSKPILPAPNPVPVNIPINKSEIKYVMNKTIYERNKYYPGKLLEINVWHGLQGKTIIVIRYYPVQYDPATNHIYLVKDAYIYIDYPKPIPVPYASKSLLILTIPRLVDTVEKLANYYENKGYNVSIVTTSYIWKNYSPINNITGYQGFYNPGFNDDYYKIIANNYNWSLALKIINYLRSTLGSYDDLLIVGSANDIPPSFYYHYHSYSTYDNWVPTDFFYASPDLDLAPNIYVGRIPFSDPDKVSQVINKIIAWYGSGITRSRNLYITAGYLFDISLIFGETAASMMNLNDQLSMFNVHLLTRTSGNYNASTVYNIMSGHKQALWYFAICHGSGVSLADLMISGSENNPVIYFEDLMNNNLLLYGMTKNSAVPIVSSIACLNAAWDNNIPSPWFYFPSFGETLLLSPAGGIAYIGSARVAWSFGIFFSINKGFLKAYYAGVTYLHYNILKAYSSLMGKTSETTLGYVVDMGLLDYVSSLSSTDSYVLGEFFKLSLLGDPNLILPVWNEPAQNSKIYSSKLINYNTTVPSTTVCAYSSGELPIYSVKNTIQIITNTTPANIIIDTLRLDYYKSALTWLAPISRSNIILNESGIHMIKENLCDQGGLVLVKLRIPGWDEVRLVLGSIGLKLEVINSTVSGPPRIHIKVIGINFVNARMLDIYLSGRIIAVNIPVKEGNAEWNVTLPILAPGIYSIEVIPLMSNGTVIPCTNNLTKYLTAEFPIYAISSLTISTSNPPLLIPDSIVNLTVHTYYHGIPVKSSITAIVRGSDNKTIVPKIVKNGIGSYNLVFRVGNATYYTVIINATALKGYYRLYGHKTLMMSLYPNTTSAAMELKKTAELLAKYVKEYSDALKNISTILKNMNTTITRINATTYIILGRTAVLEKMITKILSSIASNSEEIHKQLSIVINKLDTLSLNNSNILKILENNTALLTSINQTQYEIKSILSSEIKDSLNNLSSKLSSVSDKLLNILETMNTKTSKEIEEVNTTVTTILHESIPLLIKRIESTSSSIEHLKEEITTSSSTIHNMLKNTTSVLCELQANTKIIENTLNIITRKINSIETSISEVQTTANNNNKILMHIQETMNSNSEELNKKIYSITQYLLAVLGLIIATLAISVAVGLKKK